MKFKMKKRLRILAISHNFPYDADKTCGIWAARQLVEMQKLGMDITVFVPNIWAPQFVKSFRRWEIFARKRKLCQFDGLDARVISFLRSPGKWCFRWDGLSAFYSMRNTALRIHRKKPFDIIFALCLFPEADAALRLSKILNTPCAALAIGHDVNVLPHLGKIMYRHFVRVVNSLDAIMACGSSVASKINAVSTKQVASVYGVVDLEEFTPVSDYAGIRKELNIPLDKFVALYSGHFIKEKGIYEMVEAFDRIQKVAPNVMLIICGVGLEQDRLIQLIKEKNLSHIIQIVGLLDPEQINRWMQASDLFVLPSYNEGMPNAVMEAMACGVPVVTTAVGGLPDAVGDCDGAILVQPKNVDELQQAILKVIRDDQLRQRMSVAARKIAEEKFDVRRNAKAVMSCLSSVIDSKGDNK